MTVPNPSGSGSPVSNSVTYDANGRVALYTDALTYGRKYTYGGGTTSVSIGTVVGGSLTGTTLSWTQNWSPLKVDTGITEVTGGGTSTIGYGDINNPFARNNAINNNLQQSSATYDTVGNLSTITVSVHPSTLTASIGYDTVVSPILKLPNSVSVPGRTATTYAFYNSGDTAGGIAQAAGLLKSVSSPIPGTTAGGTVTTTYTYSLLGNLLTAVTPGTNGTNVTYTFGYGNDGGYSKTEGLGEPTTIQDILGHVTHFQYDTQKNVIKVFDALGHETDFYYNAVNQPTPDYL